MNDFVLGVIVTIIVIFILRNGQRVPEQIHGHYEAPTQQYGSWGWVWMIPFALVLMLFFQAIGGT